MKTIKICAAILLASVTGTYTFAQETVVASAETKTESTTTTTPEGEEKKEDEKKFTLSGSIDTYFHSSFGVQNAFYGGAYSPSTSFADLKGFGLGMANIIASYGGEKVGFTADLVFGPRGKAAVFGTASGQAIINQMYAYYKLGDKVTLNLGQFNTFLGYEVISPAVNFHYSTSYLFSWGPFNHTGLRADFDLGNGLVAKLSVMNPTDIVEFNPVNTYTFGGQIGHSSDAGGIWFNVLYGDQTGKLKKTDDPYVRDEDGEIVMVDGQPVFASDESGALMQFDITTGWNLSEKFYLGFNTSFQSVAAGQAFVAEGKVEDADGDSRSFFGAAIYPKLTLSESFALGLRAEYFSVKNGHLGIINTDDGDGSVMEFTLSGNYKTGALTIIPEFRIDQTSEDSFMNKDGEATNMLPSFNLAAVYKF
jgi:hypothetical protein